MDTPICDFVKNYIRQSPLRVHMPGHKGIGPLGMEQLDITEFDGADCLYEAEGIIEKSQENASQLFGAKTFYAAEGSSQCIRAMLYLATLYAKASGKKPVIAAARNVHKTFMTAAALLDFDVVWLYPDNQDSYLACKLDAATLEKSLAAMDTPPVAVYLTSPDYLGNIAPVQALAEVCHRYGCLLLVDNAHGAYLRFVQPSQYPTDLGADLCCSSAHKTLPVLTGGAYLHIGKSASAFSPQQVSNAMMLFGSTSPSYLILQSLDAANKYLAEGYPERLNAFISRVEVLKEILVKAGYTFRGDEPLKLTFHTKDYGYTGDELAAQLLKQNIVCEFHDPDFLVMMLTPEHTDEDLKQLQEALLSVPKMAAIQAQPPAFRPREAVMGIREAALSPCETVPVEESLGRILAATDAGCPPAVPVLVCGERIDENALQCLTYYHTRSCTVVL